MSELKPEPPSPPPREPTGLGNPEPEGLPEANREQRPSFPLWGWIALTAGVALGVIYLVARAAAG